MGASDLIKALQNTLQGGGRPHMENQPVLSHSGFTTKSRLLQSENNGGVQPL
jgi:hypothetical protein